MTEDEIDTMQVRSMFIGAVVVGLLWFVLS